MIFSIVGLLLCAAVLHELGHYAAYRVYGIRPRMRLSFGAVMVGGVEDDLRLSPLNLVLVAGAGVVAGSLPFLALPESVAMLIYAGLCVADLGQIAQMLQLPRVFWRKPLRRYWRWAVAL